MNTDMDDMDDASATMNHTTLTAFFDDREDAEDAVEELHEAGIPAAKVTLVPGNAPDGSAASSTQKDHKGFWEGLKDFFFPDEDRYAYAEGLRRGGYLVTVRDLDADQYEQALDILDDEGAIDIDERSAEWRNEGWQGYQNDSSRQSGMSSSSTSGMGSTSAMGTAGRSSSSGMGSSGMGSSTTGLGMSSGLSGSRTGTETIPVVAEELRVGKRDVDLGRVRVRSYVVEEPVSETVNLHGERVVVDRRPVDRPLSSADSAFEDRVIEAEEHAEEAVVAKDARVIEEVAIRKEATDHEETISDTVRHTEVEVDDQRTSTDRRRTGSI